MIVRRALFGSISSPSLFGVLLVAAGFLSAADSAVARQASVARLANKGLTAGVAAPSWSVHRRVHFFPAGGGAGVLGSRGALSQGVLGGSEGESRGPTAGETALGQRLNTDRPLRYHEGGAGVQHSPHIYVIFWGSAWNGSIGTALRAQLLTMYDGLSASSYDGVLTQYFDATDRVS
jgi:hypothetical protein